MVLTLPLTWIITRPEHQAKNWFAYLRDRHIDYKIWPTLDILPLHHANDKKVLEILPVDYMIITSANSVYYAPKEWLNCFKSQERKMISMGAGTSRALKQCGIVPFYTAPDGFTSETLMSQAFFLPKAVSGKHILLLSGAKGRGFIQEALAQRGAKVSKIEVYQRVISSWPFALQQARFEAISHSQPVFIMTSQTAIDALWALTPLQYQAWLKRQGMVVVSHRLLMHAQKMGFERVGNAGSVDIEKIHNYITLKQYFSAPRELPN